MAERIVDIDRARAAVDQGSWSEAYELFRALEPLERPEDRRAVRRRRLVDRPDR